MAKQHAYEVIYEALLTDIRSGKLAVGTLLPSENEIAQHYGVSRITSRRALTMLADQGYISRQPGVGSQVLPRSQPVRIIGLAMANIDPMFGMDFIKGVLQEAGKQGYLVICQVGYFLTSHEERYVKELVNAGVQGIIMIPLYEAMHCSDDFIDLTKRVPMVFGDREIVGLNVPLVCTDNSVATEELCRRLYGLGHRNIAFISSSTNSTAVGQRYKGYRLFCEKMGLHATSFTDVRSILPGMSRQNVRSRDVAELVRFLRENYNITAVVAHTYQVGKMVCDAIRQLGYEVPRDYSVVCFDAPKRVEEQEWFSHIRQDEFHLGVRAVQCLVQRIEGKSVPQINYVDGEFVEGKSCSRAPEWFRDTETK